MFYVYEHLRNDTNAVFYVGKGKDYRANSRKNRNQHWHNVVKKSGGFSANYLAKDINEDLAYLCEQERIDQLKRLGCKLTNLTVGGEGAGAGENHHMWGKPHPQKGTKRPWLRERYLGENNPQWGKKRSEETRKQMSASRTGKKLNRPLGSKSGMKGKAYPEEGKRKLSEALKGRVGHNLGKKASEETKAKMSASQKAHWAKVGSPNKGRKHSEETKAKMRASRAKRVYTDEDKLKISQAVKAWHQQRKEQLCRLS